MPHGVPTGGVQGAGDRVSAEDVVGALALFAFVFGFFAWLIGWLLIRLFGGAVIDAATPYEPHGNDSRDDPRSPAYAYDRHRGR